MRALVCSIYRSQGLSIAIGCEALLPGLPAAHCGSRAARAVWLQPPTTRV
jgi:hypothetical protein